MLNFELSKTEYQTLSEFVLHFGRDYPVSNAIYWQNKLQSMHYEDFKIINNAQCFLDDTQEASVKSLIEPCRDVLTRLHEKYLLFDVALFVGSDYTELCVYVIAVRYDKGIKRVMKICQEAKYKKLTDFVRRNWKRVTFYHQLTLKVTKDNENAY